MIHKGKVVGFVCKFCALLNFDLGPAPEAAIHIEVVELPCAGRIDSRAVLTAFEHGADAVFVMGCPTHECMNINGSRRAEQRLLRVWEILGSVGLNRNRLVFYPVSGTEGPHLSQIARELEERVVQLGPNPLRLRRQGKELQEQ